MAFQTFGRMKSREEQLTWAKQRALICVDTGAFACAVAGLRLDLAENPLTKGVVSSDQAIARIQSGDGRGARPGLASADRVDRGLQLTHCTGPSALRRQPEGRSAGARRAPLPKWPRVLAPPPG